METLPGDGSSCRDRTGSSARATVLVVLAVALATALPGRLPAQPWSIATPGVDTASSSPRSSPWGGAVPSSAPVWFRAGLRRSVRLTEGIDGRSRPGRSPIAPRRAGSSPGTTPVPRAGPASGSEGSGASPVALAGGAVLGGAVGFAVGGLILPEALCSGEGFADQRSSCLLVTRVLVGVTGESVGVSTGAHLVNDGQGSWLASTAASLGVGFASLYLAEGSPQGPSGVVLPLGAVAQAVAAGLIEKGTTD